MKKTILIALSAVVLTAPMWAQAEHPRRRASRTTLADNDDGKVEIWRRGDEESADARGTIHQPLLQVVFLGARWRSPELQSAKRELLDYVDRLAMPQGGTPISVIGNRDLDAPQTLNDLDIQSALEQLPDRDDNVVNVVFLAPDLQSTLGTHHPGKDFDSYHSHFHVHDTNVRYVVVPWNVDAALMREATAKSTVRAILNPDND